MVILYLTLFSLSLAMISQSSGPYLKKPTSNRELINRCFSSSKSLWYTFINPPKPNYCSSYRHEAPKTLIYAQASNITALSRIAARL